MLITDFPAKSIRDKNNFIKRNRIIAGLSDATIVIESGEKGGSLVTADIANSYNRDVFALPGRVSDKYSKGCNNLIKTNKAAMLTSVEDLEYMLGWEPGKNKNDKSPHHDFVRVVSSTACLDKLPKSCARCENKTKPVSLLKKLVL